MKLKVYISSDKRKFIEKSVAYALGLITDKNFYVMENQLYQISDNVLAFLNNKYEIGYIDIGLENSRSGRTR